MNTGMFNFSLDYTFIHENTAKKYGYEADDIIDIIGYEYDDGAHYVIIFNKLNNSIESINIKHIKPVQYENVMPNNFDDLNSLIDTVFKKNEDKK